MGRKRKSTEYYDVSVTSVHTSHVGDVLMQDAMTPDDDCFGASSRRQQQQQQANCAASGGSGSSANARERARMRVLSRAFVRLKTTLPWVPVDTKLSKLDTLRLATCYIAHLRQVLADEAEGDSDVTPPVVSASDDSKTESSPPASFPVNLTWPYSFGPRQANGPSCRTNQRLGKFGITSLSPSAADLGHS